MTVKTLIYKDKIYQQVDNDLRLLMKEDIKSCIKKINDAHPMHVSIRLKTTIVSPPGHMKAGWVITLINWGVKIPVSMEFVYESSLFKGDVPVTPSLLDILQYLYIEDPRGDDFVTWCCLIGYDCNSKMVSEIYEERLKLSEDFKRVFSPGLTIDDLKRFLPPSHSKVYLHKQKMEI